MIDFIGAAKKKKKKKKSPSCWKGYVAMGKKKSPSGKTKNGKPVMVNNCVKKGKKKKKQDG